MSNVRLTGGRAAGHVLREPVVRGVRPTAARVREALFSMVGQSLAGQRVLDAFGGAGLVGLEAYSRGAEVTVVERDPRAHRSLLRRGHEVDASWTVLRADVLRLVESLDPFDGVFVDPPYADEPAAVLAALAPLARAWLVFETDKHTHCPDGVAELALDRVRRYGRSVLWVYRPAPPIPAGDDPSR